VSADLPPHLAALSSAQVEYVDQVCDRFEAAWKSGRRPAIEDYLDGTLEPARLALARELILR
jgi:hypothetical protein